MWHTFRLLEKHVFYSHFYKGFPPNKPIKNEDEQSNNIKL